VNSRSVIVQASSGLRTPSHGTPTSLFLAQTEIPVFGTGLKPVPCIDIILPAKPPFPFNAQSSFDFCELTILFDEEEPHFKAEQGNRPKRYELVLQGQVDLSTRELHAHRTREANFRSIGLCYAYCTLGTPTPNPLLFISRPYRGLQLARNRQSPHVQDYQKRVSGLGKS
jgi:hypothetical protein